MIVKGIVSAVYEGEKKLSVILPEFDNVVTRPIKVYRECMFYEPCECHEHKKVKVGDLVVVAVFNDDYNDCMVL